MGPVPSPQAQATSQAGEAEHGPAGHFTTLGVDAQDPAVGGACPYPHVSPAFPLLIPGLLSPALSLHRGIHSSHCSWRCIFLSVLVRVRSGCGEERRAERVFVYVTYKGHL